VERFQVDSDGRIHFRMMQVPHPSREELTGTGIVPWDSGCMVHLTRVGEEQFEVGYSDRDTDYRHKIRTSLEMVGRVGNFLGFSIRFGLPRVFLAGRFHMGPAYFI